MKKEELIQFMKKKNFITGEREVRNVRSNSLFGKDYLG